MRTHTYNFKPGPGLSWHLVHPQTIVRFVFYTPQKTLLVGVGD